MRTTSFKMNRHFMAATILATAMLSRVFISCGKKDMLTENNNHASAYTSEVLDKWMTLQLRLMRNATGVPNQAFSRHFAYAGIAAFESLAPGMPANIAWHSKWNGLAGLPVAAHAKNYYFPASINGAMATISKAFFPHANGADKAAVDSLATALSQEFLQTQSKSVLDFSYQYGQSVATAVFNWAETDGYKNANAAYTAPTGAGLWKPTAPAFSAPATPYWGSNRPIIKGSLVNTLPVPPPVYSTDPSSPFYQMVKQVYDASQVLTDDQKAMAIFWRDVPGVSSPGHWLSILQQVMRTHTVRLDKAALAYALTGAAMNDALISCFQAKYQYNLVRPITYIREVMGQSTWNTYIGTPAHPEYPSAHSSLSAAAAVVIEKMFNLNGTFTDHTYDYMGLAPRTYSSFDAIAEEAGLSRLYAGIHYMPGITAGLVQGRKVAATIFSSKKNEK